MKHIIKIIAFSFLVFLATSSLKAQTLRPDSSAPEDIAKKTTTYLVSKLDLSGNQETAVYDAYLFKEQQYAKDVYANNTNSSAVQVAKKKHDQELAVSMKKILSNKQYKDWNLIINQ